MSIRLDFNWPSPQNSGDLRQHWTDELQAMELRIGSIQRNKLEMNSKDHLIKVDLHIQTDRTDELQAMEPGSGSKQRNKLEVNSEDH